MIWRPEGYEGQTKLQEEVVVLTELTLNCLDRMRVLLVPVLLDFYFATRILPRAE